MLPIDRRTFLRLAGQSAAALAVLAGCGAPALPTPGSVLPASTTPPPTTLPLTPPSTPSPSSTPDPTPAADISLEAKIGQMLLVGFRGLTIDERHPIVADICDRHLGGVVLFDL